MGLAPFPQAGPVRIVAALGISTHPQLGIDAQMDRQTDQVGQLGPGRVDALHDDQVGGPEDLLRGQTAVVGRPVVRLEPRRPTGDEGLERLVPEPSPVDHRRRHLGVAQRLALRRGERGQASAVEVVALDHARGRPQPQRGGQDRLAGAARPVECDHQRVTAAGARAARRPTTGPRSRQISRAATWSADRGRRCRRRRPRPPGTGPPTAGGPAPGPGPTGRPPGWVRRPR